MLILTRKRGQTINIGDHLTLGVIRVQHGQVKLAFVGPRDGPGSLSIVRSELHQTEAARRLAARILNSDEP